MTGVTVVVRVTVITVTVMGSRWWRTRQWWGEEGWWG